jgi:MAE_28990/MAE_18760-like HEPN
MSNKLSEAFEERWQEIEAYLDFLDAVETQSQAGVPHVGATGPAITSTQQRILYSGVYLQLYNLVESTITRCISAVSEATASGGQWRPHDLSAALRREWVRHIARTHIDLTFDHRLDDTFRLCERLINTLPVLELEIQKGGGGNWDDAEIEAFAEKRIGLKLNFTPQTRTLAKRHVRNDQGALALIKTLRNDLAHGTISFAECGANATVTELRDLAIWTSTYLREAINQFSDFVERHEFLVPTSRPAQARSS